MLSLLSNTLTIWIATASYFLCDQLFSMKTSTSIFCIVTFNKSPDLFKKCFFTHLLKSYYYFCGNIFNIRINAFTFYLSLYTLVYSFSFHHSQKVFLAGNVKSYHSYIDDSSFPFPRDSLPSIVFSAHLLSTFHFRILIFCTFNLSGYLFLISFHVWIRFYKPFVPILPPKLSGNPIQLTR